MRQPRRWNIQQVGEAARRLAENLRTSPLIAQMLINRGITESAEGGRFLAPSLKYLYEPDALSNLRRAAERIDAAIRAGEKIVIYGDYDVDGITATAILWHAIRLLGGQADYYIPHRLEEGYGLNAEAVAQICDGGAKLIVTVDCGITGRREAEVARQRGVEMIITDHHEIPDLRSPISDLKSQVPECYAIVHPRLPGSAYPNPYLCGAGVALKLAWGLGQVHDGAVRVNETFRKFLIEATVLAALGTVADVVPLIGENRILVHFGLGGMKRSELAGLRALIQTAGLTGQNIDSYHAGFLLAPRINASGRMGHAREAVQLLTSADAPTALRIATAMDQQNRERQSLERRIFEQAMAQIVERGFDNDDCRALVLASEDWHPGVIGIVASRIVNRLNRPTVMVSLSNGHGQGSGRSIPGFHLAKALDACREHLDGCGGHEMAAGLRMQSAKLDAFREAFCACGVGHLEGDAFPRAAARLRGRSAPDHRGAGDGLQAVGAFRHGQSPAADVLRGDRSGGEPEEARPEFRAPLAAGPAERREHALHRVQPGRPGGAGRGRGTAGPGGGAVDARIQRAPLPGAGGEGFSRGGENSAELRVPSSESGLTRCSPR